MNVTKKIKATLLTIAAVASLGLMQDAYAYSYTDNTLGITVELTAEPNQTLSKGTQAIALYDKYGLQFQIFDQTQTEAELDAYLAQTDTEVKQQMSAYQKDMGVFLVDAHWLEGGNYPILFAEAYNQQFYFATANIIDRKKVCTVTRRAGTKMTDADREEFFAVVRSLKFAE